MPADSTARAQRREAILGSVLCAGGAMLFAAKGVIAKLIYAEGMDYETVVVLRAVLALPVFWAWAIFNVGTAPLRDARGGAVMAALVAGLLCYCIGSLLDFYALTVIGANLERALLFSYPAMVVIAAAALARRWPAPRMSLAVSLTWLGVALAVGVFDHDVLRGNALGAAAVLTCAALFAAYFLISDRYMREIGSLPFTAFAMTGAALGLAAWYAARFSQLALPATPAAWALLALLIAASTVAPVIMMAEGVRRIGAQRGAVVSTVGPPFTIVLAWLVLGESLGVDQMIGTALIIGGILVLELARTRRVPDPTD